MRLYQIHSKSTAIQYTSVSHPPAACYFSCLVGISSSSAANRTPGATSQAQACASTSRVDNGGEEGIRGPRDQKERLKGRQ